LQSVIVVYTELVDVYVENNKMIFLFDIATFEIFWLYTLVWIYLHNLRSSSNQNIIHISFFFLYQLWI